MKKLIILISVLLGSVIILRGLTLNSSLDDKTPKPVSEITETAPSTTYQQEHRENLESLDFEESNVYEYKILRTESNFEQPILIEEFSKYTKKELQEMTPALEVDYDVLISPNISLVEFKATVKKIIKAGILENPDADEIVISVYERENSYDNPYSTIYWALNGDLGNVTPEIAKSNDRSNYKVNFLFINGLGKKRSDVAASDSERLIFYRYYEIWWSLPTVSFDKMKAKDENAYEITAKELNLPNEDVKKIVEKVGKSKPIEKEFEINDMLDKLVYDKNLLEDNAKIEVGRQFNISPDRVTAIAMHINLWKD